jgi:hypothetical protein
VKADVALVSEVREWATIEYVRDVVDLGAKKGMTVIFHEAGKQEEW